jgi:hypothetical protein
VTLYDLRTAGKLSYLNQEAQIRQPKAPSSREFSQILVTNEDKTPLGKFALAASFGTPDGPLLETDDTEDWPKLLG